MGLGFTPAAPVFRAHLLPALTQPLAILGREVEKALAGLHDSLLLMLGQCLETTASVFDAMAPLGIVPALVGWIAAAALMRFSAFTPAVVVMIVVRELNGPGSGSKGVQGGPRRGMSPGLMAQFAGIGVREICGATFGGQIRQEKNRRKGI